jgi:hypothetical protein
LVTAWHENITWNCLELYYSNMVFTLKWQYLSVFLRRSTSDG